RVVPYGHRRARRSWAHDVGEPQPSTAFARFEIEPPPGAGVVDIDGAPSESARFVADVDEAGDCPLPYGCMLVAPVEQRPDATIVARPFGADELAGELRRHVDIGHD